MDALVPAVVMGFREGLEAFLIIGIMLRMLSEATLEPFKRYVWSGAWSGVVASLFFGWSLYAIGRLVGQEEGITKAWESIASLTAMVLVTTFIIWMIRHGRSMAAEVRQATSRHLSRMGLFALALVMVAREGAEIAVFAFAGKYSLGATGLGISIALALTVLVMKSMVRVSLASILQYTLLYLVLQAGYLTGYAVHEGLSALKSFGVLAGDSFLLEKAFDFSKGIFAHKDGWIGLPLNVLFGWYSKPEWIQLFVQYGYTAGILLYWRGSLKKAKK